MRIRIRRTKDNRTSRLVALVLTLSILAPLFAAGIAAAAPPCCPDCPPPIAATQVTPCHGSLFLSCCDDVTTAPAADIKRNEFRCAEARFNAIRIAAIQATSQFVSPTPAELAWQTSALRRSVVIRT